MPPKAGAAEQPSVKLQTVSGLPDGWETLTCGDCRLARKDKNGAMYCFAEPARPGSLPNAYRADVSDDVSFLFLGMVRAQVSASTPACGAVVVKG